MMDLNRNIKSLLQVFLILLFGVFFNSCKKSSPLDCFKSTGDDVTETRTTGKFNKIILYDNVNLVITQDDKTSIQIKAGDKIIKKVTTRISDNVLTIENTNTCNWMRSFDREIIAYVSVKELLEIEYRSSGDISSTNAITGDSLKLNVWEGAGRVDLIIDIHRNYINFHIGTADIYYSGRTHLSYITAASFGPVDASELSTVFTYIANKGSNNCKVNVGLRLEATITSIGNIYYQGNPEVLLVDKGDGELIKID